VWIGWGSSTTNNSTSWRRRPVVRSTHSAWSRTVPATLTGSPAARPANRRSRASVEGSDSMAVVTQIWSPAMTGDDHPRPGRGVFQETFSRSLQVTGKAPADPCP